MITPINVTSEAGNVNYVPYLKKTVLGSLPGDSNVLFLYEPQ